MASDPLRPIDYVSIRAYVDAMLTERDRAVKLQFDISQGPISDIRDRLNRLDDRLSILESSWSNLQGRMWALGAGVVILNIAIAVWGRLQP